MKKLTIAEWNKLDREEKRKALLEFREPDFIHQPVEYTDLRREKV